MKKRHWTTLELDEKQMEDFAGIGGFEIEVMSDDGCIVGGADADSILPAKKKKTKKNVKKIPTRATDTTTADEAERIGNASFDCTGVPNDNDSLQESNSVDMSEWVQVSPNINGVLLEGLSRLGFVTPTPIQKAVFGRASEGNDILAAAETGSGKTLGFGLPIMKSILEMKARDTNPATRCLCILPTRELAVQVKKHLIAVGGSHVSVGEALGGMSVEKQFRVLSRKPDIIVGTPGRIAGLLGLGKAGSDQQECKSLKEHLCEKLQYFVLDEADRLLEQAHFRDLTEILRFIYASIPSPESLQSFVFSATLPVEGSELGRLLKRLRLKPPAQRFTVDLGAKTETQGAVIPQGLSFNVLYSSTEEDREPFLVYYLIKKLAQSQGSCKVIVFVNAISYVYRLASVLPLCVPSALVVGMHSSMRQKDRLKKLDQFVACKGNAVMIATDLAARGLDLPAVGCVIHLQPPRTPESLVHRSGRTARAGRSGECVMIVTPKMSMQWNKTIKQGLGRELSSIDAVEPSSIDINQIRLIHKTASELEGETHRHKRDTKNKAWSKKTCDEADLWDSDISEENADSDALVFGDDHLEKPGNSISKSKNVPIHGSAQKQFLSDLLKNPLPSMRS
jgi:ATP-dependent RNA helicase DDX24/MAK5